MFEWSGRRGKEGAEGGPEDHDVTVKSKEPSKKITWAKASGDVQE